MSQVACEKACASLLALFSRSPRQNRRCWQHRLPPLRQAQGRLSQKTRGWPPAISMGLGSPSCPRVVPRAWARPLVTFLSCRFLPEHCTYEESLGHSGGS
jgi:hypothetical protein